MHTLGPSQQEGLPRTDRSVRQLTAIMFTDMVGYTALMQEDERRAKADRDRQRVVLERAVAEHGGRILQFYGDGTLSVFLSAIEAVRCAVEVQRHLSREPRVPLRIGLHTGDVVHDDAGVFGDGVNVASRIQARSVPGGVLVSSKVYDEIKNQPDIRARSLGEFDLKSLKRPMEVFAVLEEHLEVPPERALAPSRSRECRSVAVLPFVNMSSDPENEFFSDGITEEIINALTRVDGLQVTARTSSFAFRNRNEDVREVASKLGVTAVLEGSVRKAGQRVRITAQLIDAKDGYHIFSEVYDRSLEDIFETQDEIARTIVSRLERHFTVDVAGSGGTTAGNGHDHAPNGHAHGGDGKLVTAHTHDPEAYATYLRGRHEFNQWTPQGAWRALAWYERAATMDPTCALPYSGMATAWTFLGALGQLRPDESFPRAEAAALRALELEASAGESHLALGAVKLFYHWDFEGAYASFQKAIALTPGSAEAHHLYAYYLQAVGEMDDAVEEMETAVKLDPLSPMLNNALGWAYTAARRFGDAEAALERTLAMDPTFRSAVEALGWVRVFRGDLDDAAGHFERLPLLSGNVYAGAGPRGHAYGRMGRTADAQDMLRLLERRAEEQPKVMTCLDAALIHVGLADPDRAFADLNRAVDERMPMVLLGSHPAWDDLRDDPRYAELAARIGLPQAAAVS